jgi:hypothetical protein
MAFHHESISRKVRDMICIRDWWQFRLIGARGLRTVSRIAIVLVLVTCGRLAIADTNYSRTVELPPLRASFADLQAALDKVSSLVNAANKDSSIWQEELQLQKEEQRVKMPGHRLESARAKAVHGFSVLNNAVKL